MKPLHGSPTRLSWICGRTPIPTFPSTSKPKPSTPSSENELHKRDDGLIETKADPLLKRSQTHAPAKRAGVRSESQQEALRLRRGKRRQAPSSAIQLIS